MAKKLTQAEIKKLADDWAKKCARIESLEAQRNAELHPFQVAFEKKAAPVRAEYDPEIEKLQEQADEIETRVIEWLESQKKSVRIEGTKAVAEFVKSTGLGNRVVDAQKFIAKCVERKIKDYWKYVKVQINHATEVLGKDDMVDVCDQPKVKIEHSALTRK